MTSPYRLAPDSPSRQLLWELNQLAISTQQDFYDKLDREDEEREAQHRHALAKASQRHERIRHEAEQCRFQIEQQIKADRRRREEERQREVERQRQEQLEQELAARKRQEIERARTAELEEKRAAAVRRAEKDAVDRRKAEDERQEAEKTARRSMAEQAAETRRRDEVQAAGARAEQTTTSTLPPKSNTAVSSNTVQPSARSPDVVVEHRRYLKIHQSLKQLRKNLVAQGAKNAKLKNVMGDLRRDIRKCIGQIREGKSTQNTGPRNALVDLLKKAATVREPQTDVPTYLASPPTQISDSKGPALLLYCLNIFSKAIVAQFMNEAGPKPKIADALGTVASHIFAVSDFRWNDISLIDMLIAKMHVHCPVIFGIYGDEQSVEGRERLGWIREFEDGPFIPQSNHFERMTGLSAGFAGISLKNYERTKAKNPYPEYHYWKAITRLANVPPSEITQTHFIALNGMVQGYEDKFLLFYGDAALATLRHILIGLPNRSPPSTAAKQLAGMVDYLRKDKKLVL